MANTETGIYFIDYFRAKDNIEYKLDKINADANKKLIEVDVNIKIIEVNLGLLHRYIERCCNWNKN